MGDLASLIAARQKFCLFFKIVTLNFLLDDRPAGQFIISFEELTGSRRR